MLLPRYWQTVWFLSICLLGQPEAQGPPLQDAQVPPGLREWIGIDLCGQERWISFHTGLSVAVNHFNALQFGNALKTVASLLKPIAESPHAAFSCGTAVASAFTIGAQCADQLQYPLLAARLRQLSAIFASYDYQMKGEEYVDQSPWPIQWMNNMQGILGSMGYMKTLEMQVEPWRGLSARQAVADRVSAVYANGLKVAIVSVCDYDPSQTPLARLAQLNRDSYAKLHGYEVVMYEKAPFFEDPLTQLFVEPSHYRPAAWSKVDALLDTLARATHDWVMWLDCDSFFMDPEVRLEDLVALAESRCEAPTADMVDPEDRDELRALVRRWLDGPESATTDLTAWYDDLLGEARATQLKRASCGAPQSSQEMPVNRTLGWDSWLFNEGRLHAIASEDGLMLNTGVMLLRASVWSWQFLQKVRWMTFGKSPVTQHPWWEQTAMVYLLQMPFVLSHAADWHPQLEDINPMGPSRGFAPACSLLAQKHINGYPPVVASALLTHVSFAPGDFIVSFSGCKVYSSQEVCNQLFMSYFFQVHDMNEYASDPGLKPWL